MPNTYTYKFHMNMTAFEQRTHAELLAEAKRPVSSLPDAYYEGLRERMREAQRFTYPSTLTFNV